MFDFRGKRILVADDDEASANDLVRALETAGAQVIGPATHVDEARAYLHSGECDGAVVVVDLDGAVTTPLVVLLSHRQVPTVVAMENTDTYPSFAVTLPRCKKPLDLQTLAIALDESAERLADRTRQAKAGAATVNAYLEWAPVQTREEKTPKVDPEAIRLIELDASQWRNGLDFDDAANAAFEAIGVCGGAAMWLRISCVIRITGTAHCRAGLLAELRLRADLLSSFRIGASIEIIP